MDTDRAFLSGTGGQFELIADFIGTMSEVALALEVAMELRVIPSFEEAGFKAKLGLTVDSGQLAPIRWPAAQFEQLMQIRRIRGEPGFRLQPVGERIGCGILK